MPTPVCRAASTPRTAAPGYRADPVTKPTTPREYLSSSGRGTAIQLHARRRRRTPARPDCSCSSTLGLAGEHQHPRPRDRLRLRRGDLRVRRARTTSRRSCEAAGGMRRRRRRRSGPPTGRIATTSTTGPSRSPSTGTASPPISASPGRRRRSPSSGRATSAAGSASSREPSPCSTNCTPAAPASRSCRTPGFDFGDPFRRAPFGRYFERVFVSAELGKLKPHADVYEHVARELGIGFDAVRVHRQQGAQRRGCGRARRDRAPLHRGRGPAGVPDRAG